MRCRVDSLTPLRSCRARSTVPIATLASSAIRRIPCLSLFISWAPPAITPTAPLSMRPPVQVERRGRFPCTLTILYSGAFELPLEGSKLSCSTTFAFSCETFSRGHSFFVRFAGAERARSAVCRYLDASQRDVRGRTGLVLFRVRPGQINFQVWPGARFWIEEALGRTLQV